MAHQHINTTYRPMSPGVKMPAFTWKFSNNVKLCYNLNELGRQCSLLELTFGWRETLVISWSSTNVQVMKKMLRRQDGSGAYQMYIRMIPTMHTTYAVVATNMAWIWLQGNSYLNSETSTKLINIINHSWKNHIGGSKKLSELDLTIFLHVSQTDTNHSAM